ncbi:MAG: hypothetical protein WCX82_00505 [archaeon]|jgi:hypothetical protein
MLNKNRKGQGSLEILIIMGMLVVGVIIFGMFYTNHLNNNIKDSGNTNGGMDKLVDDFVSSIDGNTTNEVVSPPTPTSIFNINLISPVNEGNYTPSNQINFNITYDNNVGPVTCVWDSNESGTITPTLGDTCNFSRNLTVGSHIITVNATDTNSTLTKHVSFVISNSPFSIKINNPTTNAQFTPIENIIFNASSIPASYNPETDYNCSWSSSIGGAITPIGTPTCYFIKPLPRCGAQTITVNSTRLATGQTDTNTKNITIKSNMNATLLAPVEKSKFEYTQPVPLKSTFDLNYGITTCAWYYNNEKTLIKDFSVNPCDTSIDTLPEGRLEIFAIITDSCGSVVTTEKRTITINNANDFTVKIYNPVEQEPITSKTLNLIAIYDHHDKSVTCNWTIREKPVKSTSCDLTINTADYFSEKGNYTITVTAMDKIHIAEDMVKVVYIG